MIIKYFPLDFLISDISAQPEARLPLVLFSASIRHTLAVIEERVCEGKYFLSNDHNTDTTAGIATTTTSLKRLPDAFNEQLAARPVRLTSRRIRGHAHEDGLIWKNERNAYVCVSSVKQDAWIDCMTSERQTQTDTW